MELETFVAVARAGSISKAAERLGVAKSVVSRRLADLEERLGTPLISRTTRRMSLTGQGDGLLQRAEAILDDIEDAEAAVRSVHGELSGRLRVAAPLSFGLIVLQPLVAEFASANPKVLIDIDLADRNVDLVQEGFDVALRIGQLADSSLVARKVAPVRMVVAAAPAFWERHGTPKTPHDLEDLPCLYYSRTGKMAPIRYWGPQGARGTLSPPARFVANNGDFMAMAAAQELGFVIGPRFIVAKALAEGSLAAVLTDHAWSDSSLYLVYPPTRRPSARVRAFADAVLASLKADYPDGL
ncbi:MAG: LysR family transcriptional regulator [Pseudomonadota bacterium]